MTDHLTKLHDTDPQRFVELTRELIKSARLYCPAKKMAREYVMPLIAATAAFDPPAPTPQEIARDKLLELGWTDQPLDVCIRGSILVQSIGWFSPPETKP